MKNNIKLRLISVFLIVFSFTFFNLIFQNYLNLQRAYFIYEIFLIIPITYFIGPIAGTIFLLIFLTTDLIYHFGLLYFNSIFDILTNISFFKSHNYFNFYIIFQFFLITLSLLFYRLVRNLELQKLKFPALICLLISFIILSFDRYFIKHEGVENLLANNNITITNLKRFSDSLVYSFYRDYHNFQYIQNLYSSNVYPKVNNIFYDDVLLKKENGIETNILLVIVESLGFSTDEKVRSYLLNDLKDHNLNVEFDIQYTSLDAELGSTVTSEFRELCGIKFNNWSQLGNFTCIPEILKSKGYSVHAAHPYLNGYFNRREWWNKIGFSNTYFMTSIKKDFLPKCSGSYQSLCDDSFFKYIFDDISQKNDPFFLYYLSIEGHAPTKLYSQPEYAECIAKTKANKITCGNLISNKNFLNSVFTTLEESNVTNLKVYIVGDHVPNSVILNNKKIYRKNEVQAIILKSKE